MKKAMTVLLAAIFLLLSMAAGSAPEGKISGEEEFLKGWVDVVDYQ